MGRCFFIATAIAIGACSSSATANQPSNPGAESTASDRGSMGSGSSGASSGSSGASDPGVPSGSGVPADSITTALPPLPKLANLHATVIGDGVDISFDPVDGAADYRVYVLPNDQDISSTADGHVIVRHGLYRCSGNREAPSAVVDDAPLQQSQYLKTVVVGEVDGVERTEADATLGYVYATAGDGRVPVYALGEPGPDGDNGCYSERWTESRAKKYVTSSTDRDALLASHWRDDGIAFYAPAENGIPVYTSQTGDPARYTREYFVDGPEAAARSDKQVAFDVLAQPAPDTLPLMRVYYSNGCGSSHDELVAGKSRFLRARQQGSSLPLFRLHWAGLTSDTTLVVEALDEGCPFQGILSPESVSASPPTDEIQYDAFRTIDEIRAASPTGEVFVNGQFEPSSDPRPIARSFVKVSPTPAPQYDWFQGFAPGETLGTLTDEPCGEPPPGTCWEQTRQSSSIGDIDFVFTDTTRQVLAPMLGELWLVYADVGADTGGKFRLTANVKGQLVPDSFLHATMQVNSFTTGRRYPQIIISDQDAPVQWNLPKGNSLVIQTFPQAGTPNWPNGYFLEVCDHRDWDVNNQCPKFDFYDLHDPGDPDKVIGLAANDEVGEHTGEDRMTRFDVYASTRRVYLFLDGQPYGCADLPATGVPNGAVTVTFGDTLYHSGVDTMDELTFHANRLRIVGYRRFDNLGFKSGVASPSWDESRLPCQSSLYE